VEKMTNDKYHINVNDWGKTLPDYRPYVANSHTHMVVSAYLFVSRTYMGLTKKIQMRRFTPTMSDMKTLELAMIDTHVKNCRSTDLYMAFITVGLMILFIALAIMVIYHILKRKPEEYFNPSDVPAVPWTDNPVLAATSRPQGTNADRWDRAVPPTAHTSLDIDHNTQIDPPLQDPREALRRGARKSTAAKLSKRRAAELHYADSDEEIELLGRR
jgi:hypothetical protein